MAFAIRLFIFSNRVLFYHPLVLYKSTLDTGRFQYSEPPQAYMNQLFIRLKYSIAFGLNSINVLPYEKGPSSYG